jgi:hypothetical protein
VFDTSLLLPCTDKRWYRRFPRFSEPVGFHQKQFAIPESEEWLATLGIRASAQHIPLLSARTEKYKRARAFQETSISVATGFSPMN